MKWMQILNIVAIGMDIAQKVAAGKSKEEKIDVAIESATSILQNVELIANKDILKDERLKPFLEKYITAGKDLVNKIHELGLDVKDLKP